MSSVPESLRRPMAAWNLKKLGPLIALIALIILGTIINPAFLDPNNLTNVLTRTAFIGIIAVGMTFVITAGGLDLSVGSMAAFISGVMIISLNALMDTIGVNWLLIVAGMGIALVVGVLAGLINGLITTKGRIDAFIVTLGTMSIYRSLVTYLADGGTLSLDFTVRGVYRPVYYDSFMGIPIPILVFAAVAGIGAVLLNRTKFGRQVFAIGSNEDVARYSAINVDRTKTLTYVLLGLCVAIATMVYVPRLGSASATTGLMWELEAIAAVIIGGTLLKGGYGRIWGTVVGAIILSLIGNILNLTGAISSYLNGAVQGIIIIVAVLMQGGLKRR